MENYSEGRYRIQGEQGVIIGQTPEMAALFALLNKLADTPATILIRGESGTGKELVAKALHYNGRRRDNQFVTVNCSAIPETLLESILFGHVKGSFTGAIKDNRGLVRQAEGGTLFLDEIGDMSPYLQAKILRLLESKEYLPLGDIQNQTADVRIVAATHKNLEEEMKKGNFRQDLFYRLNVMPLHLPPLRYRKADIPLLVSGIIEKFNRGYEAQIEGANEEAIEKLMGQRWEGNVRQLENVIERSFIIRNDGVLGPDNILLNIELPYQDKPWYEDGAFPILLKDLAKMEGVYSRRTLSSKVARNRVAYSVNVGGGYQNQRMIIVLTPDNIDHFFSTTSNGDYRNIRGQIDEGLFNDLIHNPFGMFSVQTLRLDPNSMSRPESIKSAIDRANVYLIDPDRRSYFALPSDEAGKFVPESPDRERRIVALQANILDQDKRFRQWRSDVA